MPGISAVFTITRAAQMIGRNEQLIRDLSDQLTPEDGVLWIHDANDVTILAFTPAGIEALRELIRDQVDCLPSTRS